MEKNKKIKVFREKMKYRKQKTSHKKNSVPENEKGEHTKTH